MFSVLRIPFTEDLIDSALRQAKDQSLFVFPTKVSAARARQRWLENWRLEDCEFLSMDELKANLLLPDTPAVSDDKRLLCLYQSLTTEDREHFHINSYFDIVEWGGHFFQFFGELCDECFDAEALRYINARTGITITLLDWQETYLARLLDIRANYQKLISGLGFTDPIFYLSAEQASVPFSGRRLVFVNQYYYSKLEKALLAALEEAGNEIVVITQGTEDKEPDKSLNPPSLDLAKLDGDQLRTRNIKVIESAGEDQMVLSFLLGLAGQEGGKAGSAVIVDSQFSQKHYSRFFDPARFAVGSSTSMVGSGIYSFLNTLGDHLTAMAATQDGNFLPVRKLLEACSQHSFLSYYQPDLDAAGREALLKELRWLCDQDLLYVDKELRLFQLLDERYSCEYLPRLLQAHFALLGRLAEVRSPRGFIDLIDAPEGLSVSAMCSAEELEYSNILEQFYQRLANFASLEELRIVLDWQALFGTEGLDLAGDILRLFLEGLAGASVSYKNAPANCEFDISNLHDLRNLSYEKTVIFHAIEGEYPPNPSPVWLLNENQRALLGLKSYPLLRERERYYFFRQIFSSREALIYTYSNQERDINPGSFVTELLHAVTDGNLAGIAVESIPASPPLSLLFQARALKSESSGLRQLLSAHADRFDPREDAPEDFFTLPSEPEQDFGPGRRVKVSYQSISQLDKNPFVWYVRELRGLKRLELRPQETISRRLFGHLLHGFLSRLLNDLYGWHSNVGELAPILDSEEVLSKRFQDLLATSIYLYKLPHNYNQEFLSAVIADCVVWSVRQFYHEFLERTLADRSFELMPEKERMTDFEQTRRILTSHELGANEYQLAIRGIADLRIECQDQNIIVDFKTGGHDDAQLIFYEWFYYLLREDYDGKDLFSAFWLVFDQRADGSTNQGKRDKWRERMRVNLATCLEQGYSLGTALKDRKDMANITRADLWHREGGEQ